MRHLLGLTIAVGLGACDATVATLPEERARRVLRALEQVDVTARTRRVGDQVAIAVSPDARTRARSIIQAVDLPEVPPTPTGLVLGPTAAKLAAHDRDRRRLEAALLAMPGVLGARVAQADGAWVAVVTTLPDTPALGQRVSALLGPTARVAIEPIAAVERGARPGAAEPAVTGADPSVVLSSVIGVLVLTILGLLAHVRRLRRSLGQ